MIRIELFGVPRLRAGCRELQVDAVTAAEAMAALATRCPQLQEAVLNNGWPLTAYRLSLNGRDFIVDPETPVCDGDSLLLMAADAGG